MVHARKQDFACSTLLSLFGPCQQFFIGFDTPAVQVTLPSVFCLLGIYRQNANLRTEVLGNVINQLRVANGGRIDRDLIRSGIQQAIYIAQFIDATAHGKRDIDIGSNPLYQFRESLTSFMTCSNIQKHKFICSLFGTYWPAPASLLAELGENYGLDNYSMWFNGAYILSEFKPQEKRIYTKNVNNWDAEHIYIERIEQTCNAEAATLAPELFLRGEVDGADIGSDIVADWLSDPEKSQMISTTRVIGDYSYFFGFNFEPKFAAEYEPENWAIAVNNENFRKAVFHGIDRDGYLAAKYPGDDPSIHKINTVTPKGFSVNNGKDYVFYGGLAKYTEGESFDPELAVQFRDAAKAELEAAGCKFPIKVPVNYNTTSTTWANCTVVLEQQLEELLGADFIDIIVVPYSGSGSFLGETRRNGNYALQELNWGADFMDPETWADPFDHENSYNFFCNETLEQDGINQYTKTEETAALIDQYFELVAAAREETGDMNARYEAFAAAESFYIDHAIVVPGFISGGSYLATKLNAFEGQYAMMGQSSSRYKGQHVYKTAMSQDMFDAQYAEWTAAMEG